MQSTITLRPMSADDAQSVMNIFNYYVEHSFAAYPQTRLPEAFYPNLMASYQGYPNAVAVGGDKVVGFGGLRPYSPISTFSHTAEISYFLSPDATAKGLGTLMLTYFIDAAKEKNIESIIASISSLNDVSLAFHKKHGFEICGTLKSIGRKNGVSFDVVYMQKMI